MSHIHHLLSITLLLATSAVRAQIPYSGGLYSENFDSMGASGTTPPNGWSMKIAAGTSNTWTTTITGVAMTNATGALTPSSSPTGTNNNGYNAANPGNAADRILTTSPTNVAGVTIECQLSNTSGAPLNAVSIGYDIQRFTTSTASNELPGYWLFYSLDGGTSWTNVASLNPVASGSSGIVVPNTVGVTTVPPATITLNTPWAIGATLILRWVDDNAQTYSPDQILGLNNVTIGVNTPPTVALTAPTDGSAITYPGTVTLTASASDPDGSITKVEFFDGPVKIGEDLTEPYGFNWTNATPGAHALSAVATDNWAGVTTSPVISLAVNVLTSGNPPGITLTSPADGTTASAPATLNLTATATDDDGSVAKVEFYQNGCMLGEDTTAPYEFNWSQVAPGRYGLSAVAEDDAGNRIATKVAFDIVAAVPASGILTRGPYLQKAAPARMTLCWRSTQSVVGRVRYGTHPLNLDRFVDELSAPTSPFNHEVSLTGLTPGTNYYYSIGSASDTLATGNDYKFTTPPPTGTISATRIWALGDAGTADGNQTAVRDAFTTWTGTRIPNLVLQLGDNAYEAGTDAEFQAAMFNIYPMWLRQIPFWSCLGNHETAQSTNFNGIYPYFDIYSLPTAGECGGVASGTEHYYSFDYANIHFVALDSMTAERSVDNPSTPATNEDGSMARWLRSDLASTTATWIIAYFHHPPYTKGSHNSDTESELIQMRANFLPILEAGGVDLVLCGHSHSYERSFLLDGHYGNSTTLTPAMKKNGGDGRPAGNGAYVKPLTGPRDHFGAVYAVAGSAGKISGGTLNHPAHFISMNQLGSLVIDIDGARLDATFVRENSSIPDTFTLIKQGAADTDKDGIPDQYEIDHGLNRNDPADAPDDSDGDGVSNIDEYIFNTASNVPDRYEFSTHYDPVSGTANVTFDTDPGRSYRVMYSSTLLAWQLASPIIMGTGLPVTWTDDGSSTGSPPAAEPKRFYLVEATAAP